MTTHLILTDDVGRALEHLSAELRVVSYSMASGRGELASGRPLLVVVCRSEEDTYRMRGLRADSFTVLGRVPVVCMDAARHCVR